MQTRIYLGLNFVVVLKHDYVLEMHNQKLNASVQGLKDGIQIES